jgi:glutamine synthetase
LYPQAMFKDPFRPGDNILIMCDCYTPDGDAIPTNTRNACAASMESIKDHVPWFGIEQECVSQSHSHPHLRLQLTLSLVL